MDNEELEYRSPILTAPDDDDSDVTKDEEQYSTLKDVQANFAKELKKLTSFNVLKAKKEAKTPAEQKALLNKIDVYAEVYAILEPLKASLDEAIKEVDK